MASKIEWTNETWNPVTGCTPISAGCENCYAAKLVNRLAGRFGYDSNDPFKITFHPGMLNKATRWKSPKKVFVCSMGDLFHKDVPDSWIDAVMSATKMAPQHTYQILTKRPGRMQSYFQAIANEHGIRAIPDNLWVGVTAEDQAMANVRIPMLISTPVQNKFVSVEPMLTPVDVTAYINNLDWLIVGGETGVRARNMDPNWAIAIMELCKKHEVPFFFKQMSKKEPTPTELLVKQFPSAMP